MDFINRKLVTSVEHAENVIAVLPEPGINIDTKIQQPKDKGIAKFDKQFDSILSKLKQRQ